MGMVDADLERFDKTLRLLAKRLGRKIDDEVVKHYFLHLNKYHIDTVCFVIDYWTHNPNNKKFPTEGELIVVIKRHSTTEYAKEQKIDVDKTRKLKELEDEFTLICKQICANQASGQFATHPIMKRLLAKNTETTYHLERDYSAYKTDLTNEQLYEKQMLIRRKISILQNEKG